MRGGGSSLCARFVCCDVVKLAMLQSLAVWSLDSAIVASSAAFAPCSSLTLTNNLRIRGKTKAILV